MKNIVVITGIILLGIAVMISPSTPAFADYLLPQSSQVGSFYVTYPDKVNPGGKYSVGFHYQGKGKYYDAGITGDKYVKVTSKQKTTINGKPAIVFYITIDYKAPISNTIYLKGWTVAGDNLLLVKERNSVNFPMQVKCSPGTSLCFN